MTTLFGIPNCDTVKKAKKWLDAAEIGFNFHDFRKDGLSQQLVQKWLDEVGVNLLVNKRSTTWKQLSDEERARALSTDSAELLVEHPTLIKRPVLVTKDENIQVGFKTEDYENLFNP